MKYVTQKLITKSMDQAYVVIILSLEQWLSFLTKLHCEQGFVLHLDLHLYVI